MHSKFAHDKPRWILSTRDLCSESTKQTYLIDGETKVAVANRWREVLETLRDGPIFCASPVRLCDAVHVLRREFQVRIATSKTRKGRKFYILLSSVLEVSA